MGKNQKPYYKLQYRRKKKLDWYGGDKIQSGEFAEKKQRVIAGPSFWGRGS